MTGVLLCLLCILSFSYNDPVYGQSFRLYSRQNIVSGIVTMGSKSDLYEHHCSRQESFNEWRKMFLRRG